jgi:hypothetical protein
MSTLTQPELHPLLVSELPPSPDHDPMHCANRRAARRFEKALRASTGQESTDLIAQLRAQRTVTRTFS